MSINLEIHPAIRGRLTPFGLLESVGSVTFWTQLTSEIVPLNGYFFKVIHNDYFFEAGFSNDSLYIQRNIHRAAIQLTRKNVPVEPILGVITWAPNQLQVTAVDTSYQEATQRGADGEAEIEKRTRRVTTPTTFPPNSLINAARMHSIIPTISYPSQNDFHQAVSMALDRITDKVRTYGMTNPFWDITYDQGRIVTRKPKRETDIHPTIRGLLSDIALAKNLEVIPEYSTAGGNLDFLISGRLQSGEIVHTCIEFKHAHSNDLEHGLTQQLPAYMRSKGSDFGQYCIMYFKGDDFDEPTRFADKHTMQVELSKLALSNIVVRIFDFSRPIPPSQL